MMPRSLAVWIEGLLLAAGVSGAAAAATISVTSTGDADAVDGACSLREAILAANDDLARNECPAGNGADRIVFDLAVPRIVDLSADLPAVTESVALRGAEDAQVIVYGQELHRMFVFDSVTDDQWFLIEDLILAGAYNGNSGVRGGAVEVGPGETVRLARSAFVGNVSEGGGGAVAVVGTATAVATLHVHGCDFQTNSARGPVGGGALSVFSDASATVHDSSFWENSTEGLGGALYVNRGELTVRRSTISGNLSDANGGGIGAHSAGGSVVVTIVDSTVTLNQAEADGDLAGDGGGIAFLGGIGEPKSLSLRNTIVAGNLDGGAQTNPDFYLPSDVTIVATGSNLIGSNEGAIVQFAAGTPNAEGDFVGTAAAAIDPMLEALDYNAGGYTATHRPDLSATSPVIDQGTCPGRDGDQLGRGDAALGQRAFDHPSVVDHATSDGCDIGAFERGADPRSVAELFVDDFELGHTLRWTSEAP